VEPWAGLVARYASLSSSDWRRRRGFPLQAFSMMLQHSECMLHSRPYQHMLWAAGDDRIRCSYLLRFSVYRIWIGLDLDPPCTVLPPCSPAAWRFVHVPGWNCYYTFLEGNRFTGTCSVDVCVITIELMLLLSESNTKGSDEHMVSFRYRLEASMSMSALSLFDAVCSIARLG
jgi:hypothetical protein